MPRVKWIFDRSPDSGARRGGHSAEEAFKKGLDTLVRETIQNSSDAKDGGQEPVQVIYRLVELAGDEMSTFLRHMQWDLLRDNLLAVKRGGEELEQAVKRMEEDKTIRLLVIEDRKTTGLYGGEDRGDDTEQNPFLSLARDEMYSDKNPDGSIGGSFGLGKSVLWAFSSLSTVLFNSIPDPSRKGGEAGSRFIGRTWLPYHETEEDGECTGDGWLAVKQTRSPMCRKWESFRGSQALDLAQLLCCGRSEGDQGTSALIVGFQEPGEESRDLEDIAKEIRQVVAENFWPSIEFGNLEVKVCFKRPGEVEQELDVIPRDDPGHAILCDMYRKYCAGELPTHDPGTWQPLPGAQAWTQIEMKVPQTKKKSENHDECKSEMALLVKLLDQTEQGISMFNESGKALKNQVFLFRGPRMLVRQNKQKNLGLGAQPFVAIAVCGLANDMGENVGRAEAFLKAAEPAEHDKWTHDTNAMRTQYKIRGVKTMLAAMLDDIKNTLGEMVTVSQRESTTAPEIILEHLRFSSGTGGGGQEHYISVTRDAVKPTDDGESFEFVAKKVRSDDMPWQVDVKLVFGADAGSKAEKIPAITSVECGEMDSHSIHKGIASIKFTPDVRKARIRVNALDSLMPVETNRCERKYNVDGFAVQVQGVA